MKSYCSVDLFYPFSTRKWIKLILHLMKTNSRNERPKANAVIYSFPYSRVSLLIRIDLGSNT